MKRVILLLLAVLMLIPSCSSNEESKVAGKWQNSKYQMFGFELTGDHTGSMRWSDRSGKQFQAPLKWSMVKGEKKVSVETNLEGRPNVGVFDFKDDKMVSPSGLDVYVRVN